MGAGRFGRKAAAALRRRYPESDITVIDHSPEACNIMADDAMTTVCMDGASFLFQQLNDSICPDWIIPVIPVHLAFEWIRLELSSTCWVETVPIPDNLGKMLPNVFYGRPGEIFTSHASFICPDNCSEPQDICSFTRMPRKQPLYQTIESINCDGFIHAVLQSQQLAPGIGGFSPQSLKKIFFTIQQTSAHILLSTACKCHGVVQAFKKTALPGNPDLVQNG